MSSTKVRDFFRRLFGLPLKLHPKDAHLTEAQVIAIAKSAVENKGWRWEGNPSISLCTGGEETDQIIAIAQSAVDSQDPNWIIDPNIIVNSAKQDNNYIWWNVILNLDVIDSFHTVINIDDKTGQAISVYQERWQLLT